MSYGARQLGRFTSDQVEARHLAAVDAEQHHLAWRLCDGREVLHVGGVLWVWWPDGRVKRLRTGEASPSVTLARYDAGDKVKEVIGG